VRVGVDPADEALARSRNLALDRQLCAGQREARVVRVLVDSRRACALDATDALTLAFEREHAVRDPGSRPGTELDSPDRDGEPGVGAAALEVRAVQPDPALCVLRAPVVPDHAGPVVERHRSPADGNLAAEARRRMR